MGLEGSGYGAGTIIPSEGQGFSWADTSLCCASASAAAAICSQPTSRQHQPIWRRPFPALQPHCAGPAAVAISADAYAKQGAAVVQFFQGYGLLPRLATGTNQLMFIGWVHPLVPLLSSPSSCSSHLPALASRRRFQEWTCPVVQALPCPCTCPPSRSSFLLLMQGRPGRADPHHHPDCRCRRDPGILAGADHRCRPRRRVPAAQGVCGAGPHLPRLSTGRAATNPAAATTTSPLPVPGDRSCRSAPPWPCDWTPGMRPKCCCRRCSPTSNSPSIASAATCSVHTAFFGSLCAAAVAVLALA
jgi:hypothetical protein